MPTVELMMTHQRPKTSVVILMLVVLCCCSVNAQPLQVVYFDQYLEKKNSSSAWAFEKFCPVSTSLIARRVLESYGSMFVAHESVNLPPTCVQKGESQVNAFQNKISRTPVDIDGVRIELQSPAAQALQRSLDEATTAGLRISPLDGAIAGGRSYGDTLMIWNSRVFPAMDFWIKRGRLPETARDEVARLELPKKLEKILEWESQGIYFSTDRTRSVLTSTAPPGTSQHLALIAFDVVEFRNPTVRGVLNKNGWFQTIVDDPAHFTYLGFRETELPSRGLLAVFKGGHLYWIPNLLPLPNLTEALDSSTDAPTADEITTAKTRNSKPRSISLHR